MEVLSFGRWVGRRSQGETGITPESYGEAGENVSTNR
jgi:hypothetical protein